jgi:hypothetical protein
MCWPSTVASTIDDPVPAPASARDCALTGSLTELAGSLTAEPELVMTWL